MPAKPRKRGMTAANFRKILSDSGKNQSEAAELLGVSLRSVNRWARGKGIISEPMAAAIRATFKTS